jgi:DNA-binding NtrC family response regulator
MITMGSFLENYKNGMDLTPALDLFLLESPKHELALTIKQIREAIGDIKNIEKTIKAANQIDYEKYAVEEQLIFLNGLCSLYLDTKRLASANSILSKIKRLATPNLPPEWQIIPLGVQADFYLAEGLFRKRMEVLEQCMEILPPKSGRYNVVLWAYLSQLCLNNEFLKFEKYFETFKKYSHNTIFAARIDYLLLLKTIEMGNFQSIESIVGKMKNDPSTLSRKEDIAVIEKTYQIFIKNDYEHLNEEITFDWILISTSLLLKKNVAKALEWARKCAEEYIDFKMAPSFYSYYLIRAELANGNANAAQYALESRKKNDNTCVYDDYFWFRIYHSKGDKEKAQYFFNVFSENANKYNLESRFDVELQLSPEISFSDLRYYSRNLDRPITSIPAKPILNKNTNANKMDFIIGESSAINQVKNLINKFALVDTTVLIVGETGTGKELIAKALWKVGSYQTKPFIPINCGALSDHLLQSELFGHKKGAFTGAYHDHKGVFEEAENGIVFLDEIGEISPSMQISLLRILEAREFRPVGSNETKKINCKIIAATNKDLSELVKNKTFREDLQFRLERLVLEIPPLRKRSTDIPILINYFLNDENSTLPPIFFDAQALEHLSALPWRGNIRELRNEMEKVRLFYSDKKILTINELSDKYKKKSVESTQEENLQKNQSTSSEMQINLNSKFRRLDELKNLFSIHQKFSRLEVVELLKISPNTAASYLEILEKENFICRQNIPNTKTIFYKLV